MNINENLRKIRKERKFSKQYVAENSHIKYTTYLKYENGERTKISIESLCKLADFYNVSVDYLIGRNQSESYFEGEELSVPPDEFNAGFKKLPSEIQNYIKIILVYMTTGNFSEKSDNIKSISAWAVPPVDESKAIASEDTDSYELKEPPENELEFEKIDEAEI